MADETKVQMNFAMPRALHTPLKTMAAQRNKTLTSLMLEILAKAVGVPLGAQKGGA